MPWQALGLEDDPDDSGREKGDLYVCDDDTGEKVEAHDDVKQQHAVLPAASIRQGALLYKTQQRHPQLQPGAGFPIRNCSPNVMKLKEGLHKVIPASYSIYAAIHT
jgi:hypothetical protein